MLHAAHTYVDDDGKPSPIIHRDVSPHNVLLSRAGHVKLADFGIAKASDGRVSTEAGVVKGKTSYFAPEVIEGGPADARADIFAAGIVLYLLLTGRHPFMGKSLAQTVDALVHGDVPRVGTLRPDVPVRLQEISRKAMARSVAARYQTAAELQAELEAFILAHGRPAMVAQVGSWVVRALEQRTPEPAAARMEPTRVFLADA